jgi:predicted XRE-type DNA-binding protein
MTQMRGPIGPLKEQLRHEIIDLVGDWDQFIAGKRLGTDQARVSDLRRGRLERFSLEKLILFLTNLGLRVEIKGDR